MPQAVKVTLAADTVSPGAMDAGLSRALFRGTLAFSLAVAFVVITVPINRWMIGRGTGHAVVHGCH